MAGVSWGQQPPGQRPRVKELELLDPPLAGASCCRPLLSPGEMRNAIVQAAGAPAEEMRERSLVE